MPTHLFIVTGHSRGLGAALADRLLARGHALLCLARRANAELAAKAGQQAVPCEQWPVDLAER